jgi:hypothetical protein
MQFLIVLISYLINTQHVSSDIRSSSGILFIVHTASGYLRCYLSVALSCSQQRLSVVMGKIVVMRVVSGGIRII